MKESNINIDVSAALLKLDPVRRGRLARVAASSCLFESPWLLTSLLLMPRARRAAPQRQRAASDKPLPFQRQQHTPSRVQGVDTAPYLLPPTASPPLARFSDSAATGQKPLRHSKTKQPPRRHLELQQRGHEQRRTQLLLWRQKVNALTQPPRRARSGALMRHPASLAFQQPPSLGPQRVVAFASWFVLFYVQTEGVRLHYNHENMGG